MDFQIYLDDYLLTFLPWHIAAPHQQFRKLFPKDRADCMHVFFFFFSFSLPPPPIMFKRDIYWLKHDRLQVMHYYILIYSRGDIPCLRILLPSSPWMMRMQNMKCRWGTCPHLLSPLHRAPVCSSFPSQTLLEGAPRGGGQWWPCLHLTPFPAGAWSSLAELSEFTTFALSGKERELSLLGERKGTVLCSCEKSKGMAALLCV